MNIGKNPSQNVPIAEIHIPLVPKEPLVAQSVIAITQKNLQCMRSVIHVDGSKDIKTNVMDEINYRSFVKPDVAVELRTLGFNSECDYFYFFNVNDKPYSLRPNKWYKFPENWNATQSRMTCPTYSEAFNWFLKERGLWGVIRISPLGVFSYEIWKSKTANDWRMIAFSNLMEFVEIEKIQEDCLKRLITLVNKNDL